MFPFGFLSLSWLWLLALAVPIVIFYFLKLRRPRTEVPSLALWQQVMNDQRVNSPLQKFKKNLLLLLQLLLLLMLTLAATQPFFQGDVSSAHYVPVLVDVSASMAATDSETGKTRLQLAKEELHGIVDNLLSSQQLSIIAIGASAERLTDFTDNQRLLHAAVDRLKVVPTESQLVEGLRVTQALTRTRPVEEVLLITDGNVPPEVPFNLPFSLKYHLLPAAGPNLGITELNARRAGPNAWAVFARVESSVGEPDGGVVTGRIEIAVDGEVIAAERVSLAPRDPELKSGETPVQERYAVRVETDSEVTVSAKLLPDGFDALASDNSAAMTLAAPRPLTVYCPEELLSYRHALATIDNLAVFPAEGITGPSAFDLVISDRASDLDIPATTAMFVGVIPPELKDLVSTRTGLAELVEWKRSEPLLRHVQLAQIQISTETVNAEGVSTEDYENFGYETLAFGGSGPLLLKKSVPSRTSYYFLVHTDLTTLPYRIGFPIMVANLVQQTLRTANLLEVRAGRTGVLDPIPLSPKTDYRVVGPSGEATTITTDADGLLAGVPAPEIGEYVVTEDGRKVATVYASLVSSRETGMAVVETLQFNEVEVEADASDVPTDKPLWRYFAFAGLAFLMTEWWFFHRRAGRRRG